MLDFSSRDRYLWMAGPFASDSMKQPGMKSIGAGPRIANSSFRISIHAFNRLNTPWVNGLATGNSGNCQIINDLFEITISIRFIPCISMPATAIKSCN